ncbi:MAG: hypothetical protein L0H84_00885 [Pseudonocardia sp.]|nr:hypothetical protein [Pseudonocardia sp.]
MRVDIDTSGPIFDGRAARAAREFVDDAEEAVALQVARWVREGTTVFRQPTGHARSKVRVVKRAAGRIIQDGGLIYWPWLEDGHESLRRNTRFDGYHIWAHATERARSEAGEIAERRLPRFLRRMG